MLLVTISASTFLIHSSCFISPSWNRRKPALAVPLPTARPSLRACVCVLRDARNWEHLRPTARSYLPQPSTSPAARKLEGVVTSFQTRVRISEKFPSLKFPFICLKAEGDPGCVHAGGSYGRLGGQEPWENKVQVSVHPKELSLQVAGELSTVQFRKSLVTSHEILAWGFTGHRWQTVWKRQLLVVLESCDGRLFLLHSRGLVPSCFLALQGFCSQTP